MWSVIPKQDLEKFNNKYLNKLYKLENKYILSENDSYFFLPRYFYNNYPFPSLKLSKDANFIPKSIDLEFVSELRDEQKLLIKRIKQIYDNTGKICGIIKARPGFGKTICSAYLTCLLKKKTLIILDNSKLAEQWMESFLEFTTIKKDDIGLIKGDTFISKPVTITMVQTLINRIKSKNSDFYKNLRNEGFDLIIFDETHKTSSAPKFALSSLLLNSENIIGLSATPFGDELHKLFMDNIIGNIIFESESYDLVPKVHFMCFKSSLDKSYYNKVYKISDYIKKISYYNSVIHNSHTYLNLIYRLAKSSLESGRKTIIIIQTIKQLNTIIEYFQKHNIKATPFMSEKKIIDKNNDNLLVATYKMASHGFDYADLSCLILATPLKGRVSLIQTIGRILRITNNKKQPLVFDLMDKDYDDIFKYNIKTKKNILEGEFQKCEFVLVDDTTNYKFN